jgi:DNA-binding transcriptional ArsR family regulator
MDLEAALIALNALAQETRLWTLRILVQAGPGGLSAGEIADALGCRQNTMSSHLKLLHMAGLVDSRREGRSIVYSARFGTVRELVLFLMEDCCAGNAAVCRPVAQSLSEQNTITACGG